MSIRSSFFALVISFAVLVSTGDASANFFYQGPDRIPAPEKERPDAQVFFPKDYRADSDRVWPVIVLLHGYSVTGMVQEAYFGLRPRLSQRGFILVVPNGTRDENRLPFWNATEYCCDFRHTGRDDSGYLVGLVRDVSARYRVDADRIYLLGHSNGGFMANRLACDAGELFAGIVSLAGAAHLNPALCKNQNPISMLQIHAVDDPTIRFDGTIDYPGAATTVQRWTDRNRCATGAAAGEAMDLFWSNPGAETHPQTWSGCAGGTEVALWTLSPHSSRLHSPHIPTPNWQMSERILDFLLRQRRVR